MFKQWTLFWGAGGEGQARIKILVLQAYLVVEAWAIMLPPIGLIWGPAKMAEPSTWATTWFVITTATPNYNHKTCKEISYE